MSATNPECNNSYDRVEQLANRVAELEQQNQQQQRQLDKQENTIQQQQEKIEDLQQQLDEQKEHTAKSRAELSSRISDVEEQQKGDGDGSTPSDGKGADEETTPLERICALSEHVVSDNLTANQQRARSVARRVDEYGKSVPAGIAITSSRIKRVLTAQEDSTIHRQTVKRVANFLKQFGDGSVKIKETRGGKTTVVFDEKLVDGISNGVVTDNTDGGVTATTI